MRRCRQMSDEKRALAKRLRGNQTSPERLLWERLRRKQLGPRFIRQAMIWGYIADFYCAQAGLVVEVDGLSHREREEYDAARDQALARHGIKTLRFSNDEVRDNIDRVVITIRGYL